MNTTETRAYLKLLETNRQLVDLVHELVAKATAPTIVQDAGGVALPDLTDQELTALIAGVDAPATTEAECPPPILKVAETAAAEGMKRCSRCRQIKPIESFPLYKKARDGRNSWCKACQCETSRARNAAKRQQKQETAAVVEEPPAGAAVEPEKTCMQCEKSKPLSEFGPYTGTLDRHDFLCNSCRGRTEEKKAARATAGARGAATRRMNARGRK